MPLVVDRVGTAQPAATKPYRPIGAILSMFQCRDREVVLEGPADTGKSRGCLEKLHAAMTKYPGARGAMIRKTRKSLRTTAQVTYERWVCPEGAARPWGDEEYRYPNGSRIYLLGMDDTEKVKSLELDMAYVQEASELAVEDWEILTTRVTGRGATMPYVQILADMNPVEPDFWLYEREALGKAMFFFAKHEDNPSITPERIAALDTLTGYRYYRLRLGLRVAAEGMYFEEWNPERHICEPFEIPTEWPRWLSVDYGFAAPFCCLWLARDPKTQRIYVYRDLYAAGYRDEVQARAIAIKSGDERIVRRVGDPSMFNERREQGKPSIASVYAQQGVPLERGSNQRISGWSVVRRVLAWQEMDDNGETTEKPPRLQVFRGRCPNLVRTIPKMVRDHLDPEDLADTVNGVKTEDHPVDALRYGLMSEGHPAPEPTAYGVVDGTHRANLPRTEAERSLLATRKRLDALTPHGRNGRG